ECNGEPVDVDLRIPGNAIGVKSVDFNGKEIGEQLSVYKTEESVYTKIHFGKFRIVTLEIETGGGDLK
ncbi:MAG: hypothetical protein ACYC5K_13765, partial [Saccharofermentanales bacterium]